MSKKPSKRKAASRRNEPAQTVEGGGLLPMPAVLDEGVQAAPSAMDADIVLADAATAAGIAEPDRATDMFADTARAEPPVVEAPAPAADLDEVRADEPAVVRLDQLAETVRPIDLSAGAEPSLAMRLRAAREARGMSAEQVARATRLPTAVVAEIEAGRHDQLGPAVYVRGYLRSYARAVGLADVVADLAPVATPVEPELLPAAPMGVPTQRLATRFANPVIYGVMTLAVLVPLIYLARSHQEVLPAPALTALDGSVAELTMPLPGAERRATAQQTAVPVPLSAGGDDAAGVAADAPTDDADSGMTRAEASVATPELPAWDQTIADAPPAAAPARPRETTIADLPQPMLASIAPMGSSARGGRRVVLSLDEASWVEITGQDGRRIERALLPAGSVREYQVAGQADMQIGNTRGARLQVDGSEVDLVPHTRSNVARLVVGAEGAR
jgi:cytoskeleton protein RodZ